MGNKQFKAEVKELLNIVINSLYTDKEIFIRELISNAADALEKYRYIQITNSDKILKDDNELCIKISCNLKENTITITDNGIGMDSNEIEEFLGTIAHSGTKELLKKIKDGEKPEVIGQFGVGFYSCFMVAKEVIVKSKSAFKGKQGVKWISNGNEEYTIEHEPDLSRGTSILVKLKEEYKQFADAQNVKELIKKYSNFIPYPIYINNEKINTIRAIWEENPQNIKEEEYKEFYKFIGNAYDDPMFYMHFKADVPIDIKALFFVPAFNIEKIGFSRFENGVSLYSQRVLISKELKELLPNFMRFIKGIIASEDISLNISRETMQNTQLIKKINNIVTKRFLKFLHEKMQKEREKYDTFFKEFGIFLKEGVVNSEGFKENIIPLLEFESSKEKDGKLISLKEYKERMKKDQKAIYFINGQNREQLDNSPYMELFKEKDIEVLYTYEVIDDYVLTNIKEFDGIKIMSIESENLEVDIKDKEEINDNIKDLCNWLKELFKNNNIDVKISKRLKNKPALLINKMEGTTNSLNKLFQGLNRNINLMPGHYHLEINPKHKIINNIINIKNKNKERAELLAYQLLDNAKLEAGLMIEPNKLVERIYRLMENIE